MDKSKVRTGGRAKPLSHPPGLTRTRRRYGCGGKLKTTQTNRRSS